MKQMRTALAAGAIAVSLASLALSQPPGEGKGPPGKQKGGMPPFSLGRVLPANAREQLKLSDEQVQAIESLENDLLARLEKLFTPQQIQQIREAVPPGFGPPGGGQPGGPPMAKGKGPRPGGNAPRAEILKVDLAAPPPALVQNPRMSIANAEMTGPVGYKLDGDASWGRAGPADEITEMAVTLDSGRDRNGDGKRAGSVTQDVKGFPNQVGQWFRFTVRGLAESAFAVEKNGLAMKVDYFGNGGSNPLDGVTRYLDPQIERDRQELAENGKHRRNGAAVWKTYSSEFRLPFAGIDTIRLGVSMKNGSAKTNRNAEFFVTDFSLTPIAPPEDAPKLVKTPQGPQPDRKNLIPLGGRWYYDPEPGMTARPDHLVVTAKNAHRLFYVDGRMSNPFAENMTAWLRKGHLDLQGNLVNDDRFVGDNVVVEFRNGKEMIVHARNIPNHATARFPDRFGTNGYNPSYIQEQDYTYYLPLNPTRNSGAVAMDSTNSNRALPMGTIAFAINGVAFYNPFDIDRQDATDLMDRCCGHPSPDNRYHYHKYPVCVKSPFVDEGEEHSPLIGWSLDGFPIYGPYEAKRVMAKDAKEKPLDAFNMHFDEERGWHYHVTPGLYPYVIGGYAGTVDSRNRRGPR